jgi:uncharacterized membrane protein
MFMGQPSASDFTAPHRPKEQVRSAAPPGREVARALGAFSIALGTAGLIAPRALARAMGVPRHSAVLRAIALRELATGIGLLRNVRAGRWAWGRVAGDVMDLAMLSLVPRGSRSERRRLSATRAAVAAVTALDLAASRTLNGRESPQSDPRLRSCVAINREPSALYALWRDLEGLPRFLRSIASVTPIGGDRTRWQARLPGDRTLEWTAQLVEDVPGQRIAWKALPESDVVHDGVVRFRPAPDGRGSLVELEIEHRPLSSLARSVPAAAFRLGEAQLREDLRRFKRLAETGEIPTTESQPSGRLSI